MEMFYTKDSFFESEQKRVETLTAFIMLITEIFLICSSIKNYAGNNFMMVSMILSVSYVLIIFAMIIDGSIQEDVVPKNYLKYKEKSKLRLEKLIIEISKFQKHKPLAKLRSELINLSQEDDLIVMPSKYFLFHTVFFLIKLKEKEMSDKEICKVYSDAVMKKLKLSKKTIIKD